MVYLGMQAKFALAYPSQCPAPEPINRAAAISDTLVSASPPIPLTSCQATSVIAVAIKPSMDNLQHSEDLLISANPDSMEKDRPDPY